MQACSATATTHDYNATTMTPYILSDATMLNPHGPSPWPATTHHIVVLSVVVLVIVVAAPPTKQHDTCNSHHHYHYDKRTERSNGARICLSLSNLSFYVSLSNVLVAQHNIRSHSSSQSRTSSNNMSRSSGSSTDSLATSRTKSAASVAEAASIAQGETQTRQNEGSRMARERSPQGGGGGGGEGTCTYMHKTSYVTWSSNVDRSYTNNTKPWNYNETEKVPQIL